MPNTPVPATGEAMPAAKFDRAAIMRAAWASYRKFHAVRESIRGPMAFDCGEFAFRLQLAWHEAKTAKLSERERRATAIKAEIAGLQFKSSRIDISPIRRRLETELANLAA